MKRVKKEKRYKIYFDNKLIEEKKGHLICFENRVVLLACFIILEKQFDLAGCPIFKSQRDFDEK